MSAGIPCDFMVYNFTTPLFTIDHSSSEKKNIIIEKILNKDDEYISPVPEITFGSIVFYSYYFKSLLKHPSGRLFSLISGWDEETTNCRHFIVEIKKSQIVGHVELLNHGKESGYLSEEQFFRGIVLDKKTSSPIGYWVRDRFARCVKYYRIDGKLLFSKDITNEKYQTHMNESSLTVTARNRINTPKIAGGDLWEIEETTIQIDGSVTTMNRMARFGKTSIYLQQTTDGDLWAYENGKLLYPSPGSSKVDNDLQWNSVTLKHLNRYGEEDISWIKFAIFHGNRYIFALYRTYEDYYDYSGDIGYDQSYLIVIINDAIVSTINFENKLGDMRTSELMRCAQIRPYHEDSDYIPQLKEILGITELCDLIASYVV